LGEKMGRNEGEMERFREGVGGESREEVKREV